MNFTPLRLLLLVAGIAGAQAGHADSAGLTRAQVTAELHAFKASGQDPWSTDHNPLTGFKSQRSRAEIRAEAIAHRDAVRAAHAEDGNSSSLLASALAASTRTRAEVAAEARAHREDVRAMTGEDSGSQVLSRKGGASSRVSNYAAY